VRLKHVNSQDSIVRSGQDTVPPTADLLAGHISGQAKVYQSVGLPSILRKGDSEVSSSMVRSSGAIQKVNQVNQASVSVGARPVELQMHKQSESIRKSFERAIEPILSNKSQRETVKLINRQPKTHESKENTQKSTKRNNEASQSLLDGKKNPGYFNIQTTSQKRFSAGEKTEVSNDSLSG
jgi:hypothetical protein